MKPLSIFKPESYVEFPLNMTNQRPLITPDEAAKISTDILNKYLETLPEVVVKLKNIDGGLTDKKYWCATQIRNCGETHRARLIAIEEIEKKECVHEPEITLGKEGLKVSWPVPLQQNIYQTVYASVNCSKCHKELSPEWRAK